MNKPTEDPKTHEPEKQAPISEASVQQPEEPVNDPPPPIDATVLEPMDTEVNPTAIHDPPSPKPTSPAQSTEEIPPKNSDDITITGTAYVAPGASTMLAKHSTKEESPSLEKGKAKLDLADYSSYSASEINARYLSRSIQVVTWRPA